MSWFADLAGRAENLLNNLDEQTGVVLRNHNGIKEKKQDLPHPESPWIQKKKSVPRNTKRNSSISETRSNDTPTTKSCPTKSNQFRSSIRNQDNAKSQEKPLRKSSVRKHNQYSLNNSPKTLIDEYKDNDVFDHFGLRQRRFSLPSDLEIINNEHFALDKQNLEVENAMLKNELNVVNREVSELLDRLRKTEDGNSVKLNLKLLEENVVLNSEMKPMKSKTNDRARVEETKYKNEIADLKTQVGVLNAENKEVEEKMIKLLDDVNHKNVALTKVEKELRHAQTTITDLQSSLDKSTLECQRLEKDWKSYKLRVKSMLHTKDNEIKSLRDGANLNEDTKMLMDQLESLKEQKQDLLSTVGVARNECEGMKQYVVEVESRRGAAERVVAALRDALKEERDARNRAEAHCGALNKDLQDLQLENGQTITTLRKALQDKEEELNHLRETPSTVQTSDTSALNVADYDVTRNIDSEKVHYLTQTLIQKQGKIDTLLADNNMLRIQLDKIESKYRSEMASLRAKYSHSVVHLQDGGTRARNNYTSSPLDALSLRIGVMIKRFPIFRVLILIYMDLQDLQLENGQTITTLRKALQDKEEELNHLRETPSTVQTSDTSALNVADYDVTRNIDSEKVHYLTQTLIQKQGKIDTLLADNNMLRIQLDKIESKYRSEMASLRAKYSHSVVHLQDGGTRARNNYTSSPLDALSLRIGVMIKRFPIFRVLILIYMIGLHLWVLTVLFTSTPADYIPRSGKS